MQSTTVRELQQRIRDTVLASQTDDVVITRHGKPMALLIGVAGQEWDAVLRLLDGKFRRAHVATVATPPRKAPPPERTRGSSDEWRNW